MSKLRFRVVHHSGEDNEFPAEELNIHSPNTRGWQSPRFCEYPQELGFAMEAGMCRLNQIQLLSHQSKISTKVEIFMGIGSDYHTANYHRLGFLTLDNNERSSFQARELKTVYIDHSGCFIKLLVHRCFSNKYNLFNQVGIIAINLLGNEENNGNGKMGNGLIMGQLAPQNAFNNINSLNDLSVDLNLDPETANKLRQLAETKAKAIAHEDYTLAKLIKNVESDLKSMGSRLAQLDLSKRRAVENEDYDKATDLKIQIEELRNQIEGKVRNIHIVGVTENTIAPPAIESPEIFAKSGQDYDAKIMDNEVTNMDTMSTRRTMENEKVLDEMSNSGRLRKMPLNIDEIVVGPGANSQTGGGFPVSEYPEPPDRAIRPMKDSPDMMDDEAMGLNNVNPADESFAPGQHPLQGVPNISELPAPEQLGHMKEFSDQNGITALLGDYRARALFSKVWQLREAAIKKIRLMLAEGGFDDNFEKCLPALTTIGKRGSDDKIAQVMFASLSFLEDFLVKCDYLGIARSTLTPLVDSIIAKLVDKLNDGGARIREAVANGIKLLSSSTVVGPNPVAVQLLKALPAKQKGLWRPIFGRIQLIQDLVDGFGTNNGPLNVDNIMNFCSTVGAFGHSNGEVREAVKTLTVALQKKVGTQPLEKYLKGLRPKQLEEYYYAFEGENPPPLVKRTPPPSAATPAQTPAPTSKTSDVGGGVVNPGVGATPAAPSTHTVPSPARAPAASPVVAPVAEGEGDDFTQCMFCGASDKTWNEELLDVHYWRDCPLLSACPACSQVVEIAGLPEHLLQECEAKDGYQLCETTGLAILKDEFNEWTIGEKCIAPPANSMYCPLCLMVVPDSDDLWKDHLCKECPANTRGRK